MTATSSLQYLPKNWVDNLFCFNRKEVYYSNAVFKDSELSQVTASIDDRVLILAEFLKINGGDLFLAGAIAKKHISPLSIGGNNINNLRYYVVFFKEELLNILVTIPSDTLKKLQAKPEQIGALFINEMIKSALHYQEIESIPDHTIAARQFLKMRAIAQAKSTAKLAENQFDEFSFRYKFITAFEYKVKKALEKESWQHFYMDEAILIPPDAQTSVKPGTSFSCRPYRPEPLKNCDLAGRFWFGDYYRDGMVLGPTYSIEDIKKLLLEDMDKFIVFLKENLVKKMDFDVDRIIFERAKRSTILQYCQDIRDTLTTRLAYLSKENLTALHKKAVGNSEIGLLSNIFKRALWEKITFDSLKS